MHITLCVGPAYTMVYYARVTDCVVFSVVTWPQGTKAWDNGPVSMKNALSCPSSSRTYGPTCECVCVRGRENEVVCICVTGRYIN